MDNRDINEIVQNWVAPAHPKGSTFEGQIARLVPLSAKAHSEAIFAANSIDDSIWDYLPYGPYTSLAEYRAWVNGVETADDPTFFAIFDKQSGQWSGVASYLRITPEAGSIEVGHINYSQPLQRTRAATEAMYLMMKWAFAAGYRRYEWKCNAANLRSRAAAQRYGFSYEGVFRQAAVFKGRNRDTAWFACIDAEWPQLKAAFETWLAADNFDSAGQQIRSLRSLTEPVLVNRDPRL